MPSSRYADHTYAGSLRGSPPTGYTNTEYPWAFGAVRVDALDASEPLSPIIPGREITYHCEFKPDTSHIDTDHLQRAQTLANYLPYADDVLTFDPAGTEVFYREQYDGPSSLVRVAPLQHDHDATWVDGDPPPGRDSIHRARWAVVTGGTFRAPAAEKGPVRVVLETTTIAAADPTAEAPSYDSRDAVIAAAERNGF